MRLSVDGLNINWAFLNLLKTDQVRDDKIKFFDTGSCDLHAIHNAFRHGVLLRSIFNNSPKRREIYMTEQQWYFSIKGGLMHSIRVAYETDKKGQFLQTFRIVFMGLDQGPNVK